MTLEGRAGAHDDGVFNECKISDQESDDDIASINSKDNYDDADDADDDDDQILNIRILICIFCSFLISKFFWLSFHSYLLINICLLYTSPSPRD